MVYNTYSLGICAEIIILSEKVATYLTLFPMKLLQN